MQLSRRLIRISLLLIATAAFADDSLHLAIRNFYAVNEQLLRGGEPTPDGIRELAANHVATVIDLREPGKKTESEKRAVESLGMKYENIPLGSRRAPTQAEVKRVLSLILPDGTGRTFVHCWRGKDRTGTIIACYRIQHDGWSSRQALKEAEQRGLSHAEFGMRSFILKFSPLDLPAPFALNK